MRKVWWDPCLSVRPVDRSPREIVRGSSRRARKDVPDRLRPDDGPRARVLPGVGLVLLVVDVKPTIDFPHLVSMFVLTGVTQVVPRTLSSRSASSSSCLRLYLRRSVVTVTNEQDEVVLGYCWMCTRYLPTWTTNLYKKIRFDVDEPFLAIPDGCSRCSARSSWPPSPSRCQLQRGEDGWEQSR